METVLVVEDDRVYARTTTNWLVKNGINARYVLSVDSAKVFLEGHKVDLLLSDFRLNDSNGVELLEWMKAQGYRMPFLIMTGYGDIPGAVEAVKRGAADYLPKPIQTEKVLGIIRGLLNRRNRKKVKERAFYVGKSPLAVKLQNIVRVVAPADSLSVLIRGASGTGKEYVARQVHALSGRADAPFIAVDCGVLPKELAASELFGHVKGAFTGATEHKTGMFAAANRGTLFLDEVGNLNAEVQRSLLRALQEKRYRPVGGREEMQTDIRLVAATNENLEKAIAEGRFREDLFHRNTQRILKAYPWPGNIRELRTVVRRATLLAKDGWITATEIGLPGKDRQPEVYSLNDERAERATILKALGATGNDKKAAARLLGISRSTLYLKLKKYRLD